MFMLLTLLRCLSVLIGILAYYAAFFMYEDEEGRWQSRVERLWVAIYDREKLTGSKTAALFDKVAAVTTRGFNRVFGPKVFSFQFVGVSTCYSYAGLFLGLFLTLAIIFRRSRLLAPLPDYLANSLSLIESTCLVIGAICLVLAALPSLWPSRWTVALSLMPFLLISSGMMKLVWLRRVQPVQMVTISALFVSLLSDVLMLALVRFTVRRVSAVPSLLRIATAIFVQLGVISLLVIAPVGMSWDTITQSRLTGQALLCVGIFNLFTGFMSSAFLLLLLFVLLHRAVWPLLSKLFYALARHEVIRNHMIMASIGTACLLFAFPLMPSALKSVVEWLAK
jgi:hypothetical protein